MMKEVKEGMDAIRDRIGSYKPVAHFNEGECFPMRKSVFILKRGMIKNEDTGEVLTPASKPYFISDNSQLTFLTATLIQFLK